MLRELHIKNIAVIEDVNIEFNDGFHVLTGETGAGKSILIDSINIALGQRSSKDFIRRGEEYGMVDLVFELSDGMCDRLAEFDTETEDGFLYINRRITPDGKSKCRINGRPVPLSTVRDIAVYLLTIHGQHDNQALLIPKYHVDFVDGYGKLDNILNEYKAQYAVVGRLEKQISSIRTNAEEREHRAELLKYQINEITEAKLRQGEKAELEERAEYLANIENIAENSTEAYSSIYGGEETSAYDMVSSAVKSVEKISEYNKEISKVYDTLSSVLADIEDAAHQLRNFAESTDYIPGESNSLQERIELIISLERKYGGSEEAALEYLEKAQQELDEAENSDAVLERLIAEHTVQSAKLKEIAEELSQKRRESARKLEKEIMSELADLDMQKVRFSVSAELAEENGKIKYSPNGCDKIEFLISSNPGEDLKPLSKIASGGEMSRIMLAMKSVLADGDAVETLIFDEIDTGVSGRAAQKIAEKIRMLSRKKQILCITHLAQLAGMADVHYLVKKDSDLERTYTSVKRLNHEERKYELARIIGGVKITDLTLKAAAEMLELAENKE